MHFLIMNGKVVMDGCIGHIFFLLQWSVMSMSGMYLNKDHLNEPQSLNTFALIYRVSGIWVDL